MELKGIFACLALTFLSVCAHSQVDVSLKDSAWLEQQNPSSTPKNGSQTDLLFLCYNSIDQEVQGNIYLFPDWEDAFLVDRAKNLYSVKARYRIFDDEVQILMNDKVKALHKQAIKGIKIGGHTFLASDFVKDESRGFSYFELLNSGDLKLLKRYEMDVKAKGNEKEALPVYTSLYYLKDDEPARPLPAKSKNILEIFQQQQQKVKAYTAENQLDFKSEKDLIRLFDYYNQR